MDFEKIKAAAQNYEADMTRFLRDLVKIPGESCGEKGHVDRIAEEMRKVGFDKVQIDPMGNVLGFMGQGETLIAYDGHIDTVGIGNKDNWEFDPYEGFETDTEIGGRGTSDQLGGIVSAVYGAKIMKDLGLLSDKYTVLVTGTIQEEDCDGLCWQYIYNEDKIKPEFVVITEPTDGNIYRGQRGRMEIRVDVKGISCHGSAPERGEIKGRCFPWQGYGHCFRNLLHIPVPVRRGRWLQHLPGPPSDRWRDLYHGPGSDPRPSLR